ncbi:hypothetical protein AK812_SmicGene7617 [Symbiodinium microadriaticum]|uniref:Uncharacterized protein n=1 Tax=Symbiodinium microadriaticum TaxID=2951 RepID=A0A1Q9EN67_SYMMI|nr:hypothetical protein AK812_SmicGene7617 [Symbiodinium microadriaticum]
MFQHMLLHFPRPALMFQHVLLHFSEDRCSFSGPAGEAAPMKAIIQQFGQYGPPCVDDLTGFECDAIRACGLMILPFGHSDAHLSFGKGAPLHIFASECYLREQCLHGAACMLWESALKDGRHAFLKFISPVGVVKELCCPIREGLLVLEGAECTLQSVLLMSFHASLDRGLADLPLDFWEEAFAALDFKKAEKIKTAVNNYNLRGERAGSNAVAVETCIDAGSALAC